MAIITPNNGRILVQIVEPETSYGAILLPNGNKQEKSSKAKIIALGLDVEKFKFNINDIVFVPTWAGTIINETEKLVIIKAEEILAKMEKGV